MIDDWTSYALADFLPFTAEVYLGLVERVNEAWWPLHLLAVALGLVVLALAWRGRVRLALVWLVPAWVFCGIVFHLQYHAELTWAAAYFGAIFLGQAVLLLGVALAGDAKADLPRSTPRAWAGLVLALFGLVGYPAVAPIVGRGWAGAEVFALHPDPTAVTTLGVVMVVLGGVRAGVVAVVPLLWLGVATLTLLGLGIPWSWVPSTVVGIALAVVIGVAFKQARPVKKT